MDQQIEDGLVSLGPKEATGIGTRALMIEEGTKSLPRVDPMEAASRDVRRRLVVPKRSRKKNVADGEEHNRGTIQQYFANIFMKGMSMDGVSSDFARKPKRHHEKDDEREDESLGKKLKRSVANPEHKPIKKTTGVPNLRKSRGARSRTREDPRSKGMKGITYYFKKMGAKDVIPLGLEEIVT